MEHNETFLKRYIAYTSNSRKRSADAGTDSLTYTFARGQTAVFDYTLVNEQGVWKINSEQKHA